ncbi:TNF receptor-associated factor 5-like [Dysidea avara]|uniref:TNF receptor-associated factor 5-like n=1 Tax=Dysidea avara TaxID=196820 RepID=UPI00332C8F44
MVLSGLEELNKINVTPDVGQVVQMMNKVEEALSLLNTRIIINDEQAINRIQELEINVTSLQSALNKQIEKVTQLNFLQTNLTQDFKLVVALSKNMSSHDHNTWPSKLLLLSMSSYYSVEDKVLPVIVKMSDFTEKIKNKLSGYSKPFFTFDGGHRMCLQVDDDVDGTHISVYLFLMEGPHDDKLKRSGKFPLMGTFTIELLNQLNDGNHYTRSVTFDSSCFSNCTKRVLEGDKVSRRPQFIYDNIVLHHNNYLISDNLYFRISYKEKKHDIGWSKMLNQLSKLSSHGNQAAPVILKMPNFDEKLKNKEEWFSEPFFVSEGEYKMSLIVYAAGYSEGEGTHMSVFLYLMNSPHHEDPYHWSLRGTFTIELYNQ